MNLVFQKTPGMGLMEYDAYRGRQRLGVAHFPSKTRPPIMACA